jgi:hypothetical protein
LPTFPFAFWRFALSRPKYFIYHAVLPSLKIGRIAAVRLRANLSTYCPIEKKGSPMATERTEFGVARTVCACSICVTNCHFVPGSLIPADLHRISEYLGESDLTRFALDNLLASPGAIIFTRGRLIRIRTLVPARRADGVCHFLTAGDICSIHAVSPYSCAMFDHSQSREVADALSLRGLMEVVKAWQQ